MSIIYIKLYKVNSSVEMLFDFVFISFQLLLQIFLIPLHCCQSVLNIIKSAISTTVAHTSVSFHSSLVSKTGITLLSLWL